MGTLILLIGECTPRESSVRAGVGLITRRVAFSAHTQSIFYGEDSFIERAACGRAGVRKRRKGRCACEGGGDIITNHAPLGGVCDPAERYRSSNLRIRGPRSSAIR